MNDARTENATSKKRVHAMTIDLRVLCNLPGASRTSIVRRRRDRLAKLVTCKLCKMYMRGNIPW
jgi:hypothetical protein